MVTVSHDWRLSDRSSYNGVSQDELVNDLAADARVVILTRIVLGNCI